MKLVDHFGVYINYVIHLGSKEKTNSALLRGEGDLGQLYVTHNFIIKK